MESTVRASVNALSNPLNKDCITSTSGLRNDGYVNLLGRVLSLMDLLPTT